MEKLELDLDVDQQQEQGGVKEWPQLSAQEEQQLKIRRCIQCLAHATHCRDSTCQLASCAKMKRVVEHTKTCKRKTGGGCRICQELIHLCCYHATHCLERECVVPFCRHIKLQWLAHATRCRDSTCRLASCAKMKRVVEHTKTCKRKTGGGCRICQELIHLCCYHAKHCLERECVVPFCRHIKLKVRQQQQQSMQPPPQMPGQPNAMMPGVQQQFPQVQPGQQGMQNPMQQMPIVSQATVSQQNQAVCGIYKFV